MRTSSVFLHYTPTTTSSTTAISPSTSIEPQQRSPWHSPIPYLFGGLAAMLALIAFALLILACSYWKLTSNGDGDDDDENFRNGSDLEQGKSGEGMAKFCTVYEEKILVIMAGNDRPTCLATPRFSKADLIKVVECDQSHHQEKVTESRKNEATSSEEETRHERSEEPTN